MLKTLLIILTLFLLVSCENKTNDKKTQQKKYEIIKEEFSETPNKAQLIEYVLYTDSVFSENSLNSVLFNVYTLNQGKDLFKNFDSPTVFVVYLYTSKEIFKSDKSDWIGMLQKGPSHSEPTITFNSFKLNALQGLDDNIQSDSEIALEKLNKLLAEKGLELCSLYKQIGALELECIHKADAKYPNHDFPEHIDYSDKLMQKGREKISEKYNLNDSIFMDISVFGMSYCK